MHRPLIEHGKRLGISAGYSCSTIRGIISIDNPTSPYEFLNSKRINDSEDEFSPIKMRIPSYPKDPGKGNSTPMLIDDHVTYIFGDDKRKTDSYLQLLETAYNELGDSRILQVIDFVNNNKQSFLEQAKAAFSNNDFEKLVIRFKTKGEFITDSSNIKEWWSNRFRRLHKTIIGYSQTDNLKKECLVGIYHQKIKGVAGTMSTGACLVSKDKPNFGAWGKTDNTVSLIGLDDYIHTYQALDHLTNFQSIDLGDKVNYTLVYWCEDDVVDMRKFDQKNLDDIIFEGLVNTEPLKNEVVEKKASELFFQKKTTLNGADDLEWDAIKSKTFYFLKLGGNGGRISITETNSLTVEQVHNNLYNFYSHQKYHPSIRPVTIPVLDYTLNSDKKITAYGLRSHLYDLAFLDKPLPYNLGCKILAEFQKGKKPSINVYKLLFLYRYGEQQMESIAASMGKIACWIHFAECQYRAGTNKPQYDTKTNVIKLMSGLFSNTHKVFPEIYQRYQSIYRQKANTKIKRLICETFGKHLTSDKEWYSVKPFTDQEKLDFACGFACAESIYFTKTEEQINTTEEE